MNENDYQQLARQFMDLWEKQVSTIITDKDFMRSTLAMMQGAGTPFTNPSPYGNTKEHTGNATVSPESDDGELEQLRRRVGELEERLCALESGASAKSGIRKRPSKGSK